MPITPDDRLLQFITDGGIETHIIFNMGVELPHFSAFPLNDSAAGRDVYVATTAITCRWGIVRQT